MSNLINDKLFNLSDTAKNVKDMYNESAPEQKNLIILSGVLISGFVVFAGGLCKIAELTKK